MSEIKIQMQNNMGEIIHPETNANIVKYGNKSTAETLGELEARDRLFIQTSEPIEDGLWLDTTGTVDSTAEENIIATQIKKYIDEKVITKVDKVEGSNLDILAKIGDTTSLETDIKDNVVNAINEHELQINANTEQISNLSNPNLLINGDFQVWQRGTSFTGANKYTADRWYVHNRGATITKLDNGIRIEPTGATSVGNFSQVLEPNYNLANKTITLSVKVNKISGNGFTLRFVQSGTSNFGNQYFINKTIDIKSIGVHSMTITLGDMTTYKYLICAINIATVLEGGSIDIEYIKLEQGTVATLLTPRTYAEELNMCLRYYETLGTNYPDNRINLVGFMEDANTMSFPYSFKVVKRVPPTITTNGNFRFFPGGWATNISFIETNTKQTRIRATSSGLTSGIACGLQSHDLGGEICFNAEMY